MDILSDVKINGSLEVNSINLGELNCGDRDSIVIGQDYLGISIDNAYLTQKIKNITRSSFALVNESRVCVSAGCSYFLIGCFYRLNTNYYKCPIASASIYCESDNFNKSVCIDYKAISICGDPGYYEVYGTVVPSNEERFIDFSIII